MPFLAQVAGRNRPALMVFGDDFETRDGTGERDYIHVVDVARAHLAAIEYAQSTPGRLRRPSRRAGPAICYGFMPMHNWLENPRLEGAAFYF